MKLLLTLLLLPLTLSAATYYVDFDAGSDAANGTSTGTAFKHCPGDLAATGTAASTTLTAGDTVIFKGGVKYTFGASGSIMLDWSGTSGNPITYDGNSAGTWGTGKALMTDNCVGDSTAFNGYPASRSNLVIKSIIFTNLGGSITLPEDLGSGVAPNNAWGIGFYHCAAVNLTVQDCDFTQIGYWFNEKPMEAASIDGIAAFFDGATNVTITNCTFKRVHTAVRFRGDSTWGGIEGAVVTNCTFTDSIVWGVDLTANSTGSTFDNIRIMGCDFFDYDQHDEANWTGYGEWPHTDGIFFRTDYDGCQYGANNHFAFNRFYGTRVNGGGTASIYITEGPSVNIYNNQFIFSGKSRIIEFANGPRDETASPQVVNIYNNSFLDEFVIFIGIGDGGRPIETLRIKNNIFQDTKTGSGANKIYYINTSDAMSNMTIDYNIYRSLNTGDDWFDWVGTQTGGLVEMQALGYETHGFAVDPLYVDATHTMPGNALLNDLHTQAGSDARNAGVDLSASGFPGQTTDFAGTARGGTWDIGAYEGDAPSPPPSGNIINVNLMRIFTP